MSTYSRYDTDMARTFGLTCTKAFLVLYNFIFLISGAVFLCAGIWLHFDADLISFLRIMEKAHHGPHIEQFSYVLMGVGSAVFLMSFLGCCGACCESMCMLCVYSCLLFLILLGELTCGILAAFFSSKIVYLLKTTMHAQTFTQYNRTLNTTDFLTKAWDRMQVDLQCCGSRGPQDYRYSLWYNSTQDQDVVTGWTVNGNFVPPTCCYLSNHNPDYPMVINDNQCQIDAILFPEQITASSALKTEGCHDKLRKWFHRHSTPFVTTGCILGFLQILGLVLACCLMAAIKREQSKYPWYIEDDEDE